MFRQVLRVWGRFGEAWEGLGTSRSCPNHAKSIRFVGRARQMFFEKIIKSCYYTVYTVYTHIGRSFMNTFRTNWGKTGWYISSGHISNASRKFSTHFRTIRWVSKIIFDTRAICRKKNHGHTTLQSKVINQNEKLTLKKSFEQWYCTQYADLGHH